MSKNTKSPHHTPLPGGEGIDTAGDELIRVAYHDGPTEIGFAGLHWQLDVVQPVTADKWEQMQTRADFKHFNFTEEK